jgi:hypothetical protein
MDIKLNFTDFDRKLTRKLASEWNVRYAYNIGLIQAEVQGVVAKYLKRTETYRSLIKGQLAGEFGLEEGTREETVSTVVDKISRLVEIRRREITRRDWRYALLKSTLIDAAVTINIIPSNMYWVSEIEEGFFATEKEDIINWLEWLLLEGSEPQVFDFKFVKGFKEYSRSGKGIMIKAKAGDWNVPEKFSGVEGDNWITRTLEEYQTEIKDDISFILVRRISE